MQIELTRHAHHVDGACDVTGLNAVAERPEECEAVLPPSEEIEGSLLVLPAPGARPETSTKVWIGGRRWSPAAPYPSGMPGTREATLPFLICRTVACRSSGRLSRMRLNTSRASASGIDCSIDTTSLSSSRSVFKD